MKPASVYGWAVVHSDRIDVKTVAPTTRGAIVSHLYCNCGVIIDPTLTDDEVKVVWEENNTDNAEVVAIKIEMLREEI